MCSVHKIYLVDVHGKTNSRRGHWYMNYRHKLDVNLSNSFERCMLFASLHISSVRPLPRSNHIERLDVWPTNSCRQILANGSMISLQKLCTPKYPKTFVKIQEIQRNLSVTQAGPKDWRGSLHSLNTAVFMHHVLVNAHYDHYNYVQKRQLWHLKNSSPRMS